MRFRALFSLVLLSVMAAIPALAQAPSAGPTTLEYKFKAGEIERYKLVMKMQINFNMPGISVMPEGMSGMAMDMTSTVVFRSKTLGILPNGNAKVMYTYESMKTDLNMPLLPEVNKEELEKTQMDTVKNSPPITAEVTKYGQVVSVKGLETVRGMEAYPDFSKLMGGTSGPGSWGIMFPAEPISVGDAWTQQIPVMSAGKVNIDSVVESLNTKIGNVVAAKIKQDYSGYLDLASLMKTLSPALGGQAGDIPGMNGGMNITGWGVTYFDPAKGKPIRSDGDISMAMSVAATAPPADVAAGGYDQPINMDIQVNMKINMIRLAD